ncbi:MAG: 3-hydroxyacyl-CoA dehydrogenase [Alphaproteobacteria bacterium]|nr:3-hydroxyacyl-CoA dehydrogenase [Alphaproteobacteria bacterium]
MTSPRLDATIAIIGSGFIGRGWAARFAAAGAQVRLWDAEPGVPAKALAWLDETLPAMEKLELIADARGARARVTGHATLEDAVRGVDYIQENAPEKLDLKRELHARIDAADCAGAVIGSSTSTFPGTKIFTGLRHAARCLVAHPANPPHLLPVVELVPMPVTSPAATERCRALMAAAGQVPVLLKKEIEGFVMNRLQAGVIGEAMSLIADGVIEPDDLDAVMRHSLGLRWSFMGPFETMDLNAPGGFMDYATRYGGVLQALGRDLGVAKPWTREAMEKVEAARRSRIPAGDLVKRGTWRDRRLMALAAHKHATNRKEGE